jgi:hypothetical protein
MALSGFSAKSEKETTSIAAASSDRWTAAACPASMMPGSATSRVRRNPSSRASDPTRSAACPPKIVLVRSWKSKGPIVK